MEPTYVAIIYVPSYVFMHVVLLAVNSHSVVCFVKVSVQKV